MKATVKKYDMILVVVIALLLAWINCKCDYMILIDLEETDIIDYHFNLITINSIIAGFSFTNLGILLDLAGEDFLKKLSKTSIMEKRNKLLIRSIRDSSISIIISLIFVLGTYRLLLEYKESIVHFLFALCIIFMIKGIVEFICSVKMISDILMKVYKNKSNLSKEDVSEFKESMKHNK